MRRDNQIQYEESINYYLEHPEHPHNQLMVAICWVKLGNYAEALQAFRVAATNAPENQRFWFGISMPNLLVNAYAMAHLPQFHSQIQLQLESYRNDQRGCSLWAHTAYAEMCFLDSCTTPVTEHIVALLRRPKYKDTYANGLIAEAIVDRNQEAFDTALAQRLLAHRGQAKFGGLRESPEGYLCLDAMTLARVARECGLRVETDSEYLSLAYLDFAASHA